MLLDQDGPGLSRHDSVEETGTAYLCLNQRGNRTEQNHAGCQGGSQNAQPKAKRMGKLLLPRPSQQGLPCGRSTHPQAAASVAVHQAQSEVAGEETFSDGIVLPSAWSGQSYRTDRQPSVGETVSFLRAPDAGNPHVRCDEREEETEPRQTGLRRRGENLANRHREAKGTAPLLDSTCAVLRRWSTRGLRVPPGHWFALPGRWDEKVNPQSRIA